jgi:type II restriction/modification system DNA methylase subunit YeeA
MNKSELKKFATYARQELCKNVKTKALSFGVTTKRNATMQVAADYVEVNGQKYPIHYRSTFEKLIREYEHKGFDQLVEEVAYTWFNRIIAIRYMEIHYYLPSRVHVLSSETDGKVDPDILTEYPTMDLGIDKTEIDRLLAANNRDEAYRKLLIDQCNQLHSIMPFLFEKVADFTELLLPDHLLAVDSLINRLVQNEELSKSFEEVEVIGWLYQYYISEKKNEVFAGLKKNQKITKENIPAATQLFTPKWIVKYMVENSLGQLWLEAHPESELKQKMKYYIEPAEQEPDVQVQLEEIRNKNIKLEDIKILDPACGSGHILVYAFDLLYEMYVEAGYPAREIPQLILEKNLYGIDIDDRAAQMASFALMMKAREKSRSLFRNKIEPQVVSIQESNHLSRKQLAEAIYPDDANKREELCLLLKEYVDGKNYGSLLQPRKVNVEEISERISEVKKHSITLFEENLSEALNELSVLIQQTALLTHKYDVVITNPPYLGNKGMNSNLSEYLRSQYPDSKLDLFAVFKERTLELTKFTGFSATINQHSWMFLSSFEKLRLKILHSNMMQSMVHLGTRAFDDIGGEVVQSVTYVLRKIELSLYNATFFRLVDYNSSIEKEKAFENRSNKYISSNNSFSELPGSPIVYWASTRIKNIFSGNGKLGDIVDPRQGLATADNDRFLRLWHEVLYRHIGFGYESTLQALSSQKKWFPYTKGGSFRKWYGNNEYLVNWEQDGAEIREFRDEKGKLKSRPQNKEFYFRDGISWGVISSIASFRMVPKGFIPGHKGSIIYFNDYSYFFIILSFLNSRLSSIILEMLAPNIGFEAGSIKKLPITIVDIEIKNRILSITKSNLMLSKTDWDSFETSWDFQRHPFLTYQNNANTLSQTYTNWENHAETQFRQLQQNEEELNRIFIDLYGLQDELTPEVPDEEVTVRRADKVRDAKSFLSYFIGCLMGRYSLDVEGLAYAGGEWDTAKYQQFQPQPHGLVLFTDQGYFEDDIIIRLKEFLRVIYGKETIQENLYWLAETLSLKANETAEERLRRYFIDEFYKDHNKIYQKRPIYWLVDAGKQKGFRALFYLHRYTKETLPTMRFQLLQELQGKYANEIKRLDDAFVRPSLSVREKRQLEKERNIFQKRQDELILFDKLVAEVANQQIELDLDDGVNQNYEKFGKLLAARK